MNLARARFRVRVTPKSRVDEVCGALADGTIRVRVRAAPEGGRANEAVVDLLGAALGVPRAAVQIVSGHGSREKWIEADGLTSEEAARRLGG